MKKLIAFLCLIASLSACSNFSKIDVPAGEAGGDGNGSGGLGSFSGSVGAFSMGSVVSATFNENEDKTLWVLLADGEICCSCGSDGAQEVDASMILANNIPNSEDTYDEATDALGIKMYLLTADSGSASTVVDSTNDVTITIESTSDTKVAGSYTGTFGGGDVISGTFEATKCLNGD